MNEPKSYEPPRLIRVKLNHTQAVLSVCSVGATSLWHSNGADCEAAKNCRNAQPGKGDDQSTS